MRRVYYNKLIRDNIPKKIEKTGAKCETRTLADDDEYEQELLKKAVEEASELLRVRTREDLLGELADLSAVLEALKMQAKISEDEFVKALAENEQRKGGFEKRLFLHWSEDSGYESNETPQGMNG